MTAQPMGDWANLQRIQARPYLCGHCGNQVAAHEGYFSVCGVGIEAAIYICPLCKCPTYFSPTGEQIPGPPPGRPISNLPEDLGRLYEEARQCISVGAYTAAVLVCRKLLMNIAVTEGASKEGTFHSYVEFLANNGIIPAKAKKWVDYIRKRGNEANHEIVIMTRDDAHTLLSFMEVLLRSVYEFPSMIPES